MTADFSPGLFPYTIRSSDTDFADHLQLSSLFALMQEAAYQHAERCGIGASRLDQADLTWLLSKVAVRLERLPKWGEPIWIRTWSKGVNRLLFLRDYQLLAGSPDSDPIGRATSEWLVARKSDHRPQRPDVILGPAGLGDVEFDIPESFDFSCSRLESHLNHKLADPETSLLVKFADYSAIDRNHHVNNTHYVAWSMDAAYAHFLGGLSRAEQQTACPLDLKAIDVHYLSEIKPGERTFLDVWPECSPEGQLLLVEGRRPSPSSAAFRARLLFASL